MLTAMDNLVFLQKWYLKFPQYRNTSLFIAGESYAGRLGTKVVKKKKRAKTERHNT